MSDQVKMKKFNIQLTRQDYSTLVFYLGMLSAHYDSKQLVIPEAFKELVDWILIQGSKDNYVYFHDKEKLTEKKLAELSECE